MISKPSADHHNYALLVFSLAAMAFGLERLLRLQTPIAETFAAICLFMAIAVVVSALVHYWRFSS